ncbi:MAG: BON domain-containing protein, partial [Planctomycetota bacterium JB042]
MRPASLPLALAAVLAVPAVATAQGSSPPAAATASPPVATAEDRLSRVFARVDDFRHVEVEVRDGVARLTGTVDAGDDIERAVELARSMDGVV